MIITADLIEAYLKCPTKCFLLSRDEVEERQLCREGTRSGSDKFLVEQLVVRGSQLNMNKGRRVSGPGPGRGA